MGKEMITLTTNMNFSEERLEEIFNVPKTQELFNQFIQKEENLEQLELLENRFEKKFGVGNSIVGYDNLDKISEYEKLAIIKLKVAILSKSIQKVVEGKNLDEAICETLQEQLINEDIFENIHHTLNLLSDYTYGLVRGLS